MALRISDRELKRLRKIHEARSPRSRAMDEARTAPIPASIETWIRHPNRYDLPGVDTPDLEESLKKTRKRRGRRARRAEHRRVSAPPRGGVETTDNGEAIKTVIVDVLRAVARRAGLEEKASAAAADIGEYLSTAHPFEGLKLIKPISVLNTSAATSFVVTGPEGWRPGELADEAFVKHVRKYVEDVIHGRARLPVHLSLGRYEKLTVNEILDALSAFRKKGGEVPLYSTTGESYALFELALSDYVSGGAAERIEKALKKMRGSLDRAVPRYLRRLAKEYFDRDDGSGKGYAYWLAALELQDLAETASHVSMREPATVVKMLAHADRVRSIAELLAGDKEATKALEKLRRVAEEYGSTVSSEVNDALRFALFGNALVSPRGVVRGLRRVAERLADRLGEIRKAYERLAEGKGGIRDLAALGIPVPKKMRYEEEYHYGGAVYEVDYGGGIKGEIAVRKYTPGIDIVLYGPDGEKYDAYHSIEYSARNEADVFLLPFSGVSLQDLASTPPPSAGHMLVLQGQKNDYALVYDNGRWINIRVPGAGSRILGLLGRGGRMGASLKALEKHGYRVYALGEDGDLYLVEKDGKAYFVYAQSGEVVAASRSLQGLASSINDHWRLMGLEKHYNSRFLAEEIRDGLKKLVTKGKIDADELRRIAGLLEKMDVKIDLETILRGSTARKKLLGFMKKHSIDADYYTYEENYGGFMDRSRAMMITDLSSAKRILGRLGKVHEVQRGWVLLRGHGEREIRELEKWAKRMGGRTLEKNADYEEIVVAVPLEHVAKKGIPKKYMRVAELGFRFGDTNIWVAETDDAEKLLRDGFESVLYVGKEKPVALRYGDIAVLLAPKV